MTYTNAVVTELRRTDLFRVQFVGTVVRDGENKYFGIEINPFSKFEIGSVLEPFHTAILPHIEDAKKLGGTP